MTPRDLMWRSSGSAALMTVTVPCLVVGKTSKATATNARAAARRRNGRRNACDLERRSIKTRLIDRGGSNDLPLAHDLTMACPLANRDLALPGADGTLLEMQLNECARERSSPERSERSTATARPVAGPCMGAAFSRPLLAWP